MKKNYSFTWHYLLAILFMSVLMLSCGGGGGGGGDGAADTIAPTVSATSPADNEMGVSVTAFITATFSEAMDPTTINSSTITVDQGITGTVTYDAVGRTATFQPATGLAYNTTYMAVISTGVKDTAGNTMLTTKTWMFTTVPNPDATAPVTTAAPPGGLYNAAKDVTLTTDETATIYFTTDGSTPTTGSSVYSGPIHITVSTMLKFFARDAAGNNETVKTEIYTIDTDPPGVISTNPSSDAAGVATNTSLSASFDEAMDLSTISAATFTVKDSNDNQVGGTVSYAGMSATFTPSAVLADSTTYTATIAASVKDLAGNTMVAAHSWSFTTGITPDTTRPTVESTIPADGATGVSLDAIVTATFSEAMSAPTITAGTFYVKDDARYVFFAGDVGYSGVTATFTPIQFTYDTLLTATVTTGAADLAGNALASNHVWHFRTRLPPEATLDSSFGSGGKVKTDLGGGEAVKSIVVQTGGKIIVAGSSYRDAISLTDFVLARYNSDGTLDNSYGSSGMIVKDFGGDDSVAGLALQSDGKLVVAGSTWTSGSGNAVLARYDTNGTPDSTFGMDGVVIADFGGNDSLSGIGLQSGGKIIVAGVTGGSLLVARYNPENGSLDTTFGTNGTSIGATTMSYVRRLAVQTSDDKIVIVGAIGSDFAVVRFNADGTLDTTFGSGGKVITDFNDGNEEAEAIAIQTDGKIIAAGWRQGGYYDFALARYNTNGSLDTSFGTGGTVTTGLTNFGASVSASAVAVQADGKIVAAGLGINVTTSRGSDFAVARYNADGTLDTSFGDGGKAFADFGNTSDSASAVAIQADDGMIVVAGGAAADFALVRYQP